MGDPFLRAYDVIHDLGIRRIGLVGNAVTIPPEDVGQYDPPQAGGGSGVAIIIVCLFVAILILGLFGFKVWKDKQSLKNQETNKNKYAVKDEEGQGQHQQVPDQSNDQFDQDGSTGQAPAFKVVEGLEMEKKAVPAGADGFPLK